MNLPEIAQHHKHNLPPLAPLQLPGAVHVRNAEAAMDDNGLYVTLATDANWGGTFLFTGVNIEAIRAAITPAEEDTTPPEVAAWAARDLAGLALNKSALTGRPTEDPKPCLTCDDCGQIADSDDGEPWTAWADLPFESALAVRMGLVKPIPCPACSQAGA